MNKDMEIAGMVFLCCIVSLALILLMGCASQRPDDRILRYYLTHPECQTTTNIFGNC